MSFSIDFADGFDEILFGALGDDIEVTNNDVVTLIKGEFIHVFDVDDLIKRGDTIYPTLECMIKDEALFRKGTTIMFDDHNYLFIRKQPKDAQTIECVFRNVKVM